MAVKFVLFECVWNEFVLCWLVKTLGFGGVAGVAGVGRAVLFVK